MAEQSERVHLEGGTEADWLEGRTDVDENNDLNPKACWDESAKALREGNVEAADHWRRLGDSIVASRR